MIKCTIDGLYVGSSQLANRNGNGVTPVVDVYVIKLKKSFQIFRCELDLPEGHPVSIPCELRFRQDGSPYFVYSDPELDKNKLNSAIKEE